MISTRRTARTAPSALKWILALMMMPAASQTCADVLIKNELDQLVPLLSVENMEVGWAVTADDFVFERAGTITSVTCYFFVPFGEALPSDFRLWFFKNHGDEPGAVPLGTFEDAETEFLDVWSDGNGVWETWEVTWDTDSFHLDDGHYWLAPMAVQFGEPVDHLVYWASSNTGKLKWNGASLRSPELGIDNWTPMLFNQCALVDGAFTIRGSGGRVPEFVEIEMKRLTVTTGGRISGGKPEMRQSDNTYAVFQSEVQTGGQVAAKLDLECKFKVPDRFDVEELLVRLVINSSEPGGDGKLYLKNWQTGEWDRIRTFGAGLHDWFYPAVGLDPEKYIKNNGTVLLRMKVTTVTNFDQNGFRAGVEALRLDVVLD